MIDLKTSKAASRLISLLHKPIRVWIRSTPENTINGDLDSFDYNTNPAIIVVSTEHGFRIVNLQDVSFIEEKLLGR